MNNDFIGDFIGFTFNGQHSNYFNICHVSDGSRYNENLLPNLQDMTAQVPGGDGMYYWDSYYIQRQFNVQVAFDGIQEIDWRNMRNWLGDRGIHELWFDEAPYKVYMAKIASPPQFKYICFKEGANNRTYKGEGTIVFICYYPFAMAQRKKASTEDDYKENGYNGNGKYLEDYYVFTEAEAYEPNIRYFKKTANEQHYEAVSVDSQEDFEEITQNTTLYIDNTTNTPEWVDASGMLLNNIGLDSVSGNTVTVYNAGDLPADWKSIIELSSIDEPKTYSITNVGSFVLTPSKLDWDKIGGIVDYEAVTDPINTDLNKYYEKIDDDEYIKTSDTEVDQSKTYYIQIITTTFEINTRTELITTQNSNTIIPCNKMLTAGDFFKIPVSTTTFTMTIPGAQSLEYDYLYL